MRYLISLSYDGSKFYGFQRLNDKLTVQKEIETALFNLTREEVQIKGAGRTDRGVHAYNQYASFDLNNKIDPDTLKYKLNKKISKYISINSCTIVDDEFHARFNVKQKTYIYKINNGNFDPLLSDYMYQPIKKVDLGKLKKISKVFLGIHDFRNFVSGTRDNYECVIYSIRIKRRKDYIYLVFTGKSFYRYMVRNLVGAMLDYCNGKCTIDDIKDMLYNTNVQKQLSTAPSYGLYLYDIKY